MDLCINAIKRKCTLTGFTGFTDFTGCVKRKLYLSSVKAFSVSSVKCRSIKLDYDVHGDDDSTEKPPVFVCHGLFGNKKNWRSLSKQINLRTGRKVVAYDAVNHGSSAHHENMSYEDMANDLVNLMDTLEIEAATLVGHSMGGKTVMNTALCHPSRVEKLVVADSAPEVSKSMGEVMVYLRAMADIDMSQVTTRKIVDDRLKVAAPSKSIREFLMSNLLKSGDSFSWRTNLKAIENNYHYIHSFPDVSDDVKYDNPTLFIGGGCSTYITEAEYPKIFKCFPFAKVEHIPDAGHWVHSEKPHEFLDVLLPFIG